MSPWLLLSAELDRWEGLGLRASFWWRDDDAVEWTPALSQLVEMSQNIEVPLALAVIPRDCGASLQENLDHARSASVLQHGYSHTNYAGAGEKQTELGDHRPLTQVLAELRQGHLSLGRTFGSRFQEVLVPPWNRISAIVAASLAAPDWIGMSTFGPRPSPRTNSGIVIVNSHVDIVAWRSNQAFVGLDHAIEQVLTHLRARRAKRVDCAEPTGLMTHHLYHDQDCWRFCAEFLRVTKRHPAAIWLDSRQVFQPSPTTFDQSA